MPGEGVPKLEHVKCWSPIFIDFTSAHKHCEGPKVPQSPKPRKIESNEKVTQSDSGGRPKSSEKVTKK